MNAPTPRGQIDPWMQTWSGRAFDLLEPQASQVFLCDIAMSLERIPRFNGHTGHRTWSVAHHSLLVANLLVSEFGEDHPQLRLAALLRDAHEAYIGDLIAPVKSALRTLAGPELPDLLERLEKPIQAAIHERFHLPFPLSTKWQTFIKQADMTALGIEAQMFMGPPPRPWINLPQAADPGGEVAAVDLYFDAGFGFIALVTRAMDEVAELSGAVDRAAERSDGR
jgi:uncharacterized protein